MAPFDPDTIDLSRYEYADEELEIEGDRDELESRPDEASSVTSVEDEDLGDAKARKMEALFPAISSVCNALGGYEEFVSDTGEITVEYSLGDQVIGCLKDLKRFWRFDDNDEDRTVAAIFLKLNLLRNDLIPIFLSTLGTGPKGDRIALACAELMCAMTWPIDVEEELQELKQTDQLNRPIDYNTILEAQLTYKAAMLQQGVLRALFHLISTSLAKGKRDWTQKDKDIISLILFLFRNLAAINDRPARATSGPSDEFSNLQSDFIELLTKEKISDLFIAMAHEANIYGPWNMVLLEIFQLLFRNVRPMELFASEKDKEDKLSALLSRESDAKQRAYSSKNTRHSRFGTTFSLQTPDKHYIVHKQAVLTRGAESVLDGVKRSQKAKAITEDDLRPAAHRLRAPAVRCLRAIATSFLDASFNVFFGAVIRDIRMERFNVTKRDIIRFMFLSRFFLEFFLELYKEGRSSRNKSVTPSDSEALTDYDSVTVLVESPTIGLITRRLTSALEDKKKDWTEIHAAVDCFTYVLLTIDGMAKSSEEEYRDAAEILQHKLYYEEDVMNAVVRTLVLHQNQSAKYLDSCLHLAYVILRLLEKYSKSGEYIYVRSKVQKRKNREGDEEGFALDADGMEQTAQKSYREHAFEFTKFEAKFASELILDTYVAYLRRFDELDESQLKRIVNLIHRLAVKINMEALFFKPSVMYLFNEILDAIAVESSAARKDLQKLIHYILRRFFKGYEMNPYIVLEAFLPKTRSQLIKYHEGEDALADEDTYEGGTYGDDPSFSGADAAAAQEDERDDDLEQGLMKIKSRLEKGTMRRKARRGSDAGEKRPRKPKEAVVLNYKSAQFIADSDDEDDPERDAAFFAAEAELRRRLAEGELNLAEHISTVVASPVKRKQARVRRRAGKRRDSESRENDEPQDDGELGEEPRKHSRQVDSDSDEESENGSTQRTNDASGRIRLSSSAPPHSSPRSSPQPVSAHSAPHHTSPQPEHDSPNADVDILFSDDDGPQDTLKQTKKRRVIIEDEDD